MSVNASAYRTDIDGQPHGFLDSFRPPSAHQITLPSGRVSTYMSATRAEVTPAAELRFTTPTGYTHRIFLAGAWVAVTSTDAAGHTSTLTAPDRSL
jgi:hypothetical protein